ncbi:D-erythro-7,8-dihydroneopterin triphosphate epimerase [Thalassoglobus neptunius]|uniref:7,8-dihydroneopterin aldolase n=2 Tax=Thalassoglobus neptunius TaxID=1938619 RepID=A0A5C5X4K4_9PLAN|nr:D-erythro-7,8-dihydroneopterin triphosphate epimerase [Thalassoglobus neptunius]
MADYIEIKDLLVRTIIGVNAEEREKRQDVLINLKFEVDLRAAGESDSMNDAVNYKTICKQVLQFTEASSFLLVEKLAAEIAWICLSDSRVERVWVTVEKPGALRFSRSVGVTIERTQKDRASR